MKPSPGHTLSRFRPLGPVISAMLLAVSQQASAAVVPATGTVVTINTYPEFGAGDLVFTLSTTVAGCEGGFWLSPSQPGFKTSVAFVMLARATGQSISVGGNNALLWSGSGSHFCKVDWLSES